MDLPHLKTMYSTGRLSDVVAFHSNDDHQWHLDCHDLWGHTLHVTKRNGEACAFRSAEKATMAARSIGFQDVIVDPD